MFTAFWVCVVVLPTNLTVRASLPCTRQLQVLGQAALSWVRKRGSL